MHARRKRLPAAKLSIVVRTDGKLSAMVYTEDQDPMYRRAAVTEFSGWPEFFEMMRQWDEAPLLLAAIWHVQAEENIRIIGKVRRT